MPFRWNLREKTHLFWYVVRWTLIAAPTAGVIGSACALFLWSLDWATHTRWNHPWLFYLLPIAGIAIAGMYLLLGKSVAAGTNLIMDEIHEPGAGVPARMAPLVLIGTVITHLFGGSAGREGTAVQIGGSVASNFGRLIKLSEHDTRKMLMVGIAAGFGGVFGTPLAATVFALEVIAIGRMSYEAIFPCLLAGIVGDYFCTLWSVHVFGIHHVDYHPYISAVAFSWPIAGKAVIAAIAFGFGSVLFAGLAHELNRFWKKIIPWPLLRPVAGATLVIGITFLLGTRDYLGLGVVAQDPAHGVSIVSSFHAGGTHALSWWWKLLLTAITLSCGFKGGEVTPLFFIGAALGNTLATLMHAPVDLFAAMGFVAVFAGATNTPLACTLMGVELFGSEYAVYLAIACFIAYLFSGHSGIYESQRLGTPKGARSKD